ncbi:DgyrCDS8220 [Dimorphilus gyrociliatus]|uniref:Aminopeptidase n=1 Tax=Dimorphilus gyrociliatus TaxID=2664684 RepID=A0A7I8VTS2_9ANNE|nr:DgyrCDS8220 [Dimorphilus gyrociliatus]
MTDSFITFSLFIFLSFLLSGQVRSDRLDGRLPKSVVPLSYILRIRPDFYSNDTNNFKYNGTVNILMECRFPTDQIVLNYDDEDGLILSDFRLVDTDGVDLLHNVTIDNDAEFLIVNPSRSLAVGENFWLTVRLNGGIFDDRFGFFYAGYEEKDLGQRYMVSTFFVPKIARAVFPCFDEPSFKSRFKLIIERKSEYSSLTSTRRVRTAPMTNDFVADEFDWSPIMPLYSLCWAVVDFAYVESFTTDGVRVRVYARRDRIDEANLALQMATRTLEYFGDKLDYNYTLSKLDNLAIPKEIGYAMEHWGLVTYAESSLLYNSEKNILREKIRTAKLVMHELAHQWFGNLITCEWWNHTWINEGITEFMQFVPLKSLLGLDHSEMQILDDLQRIQVSDALNTSQEVIPDIPTVWDSSKAFSRITYNKGGAIVRMLRSDLGENEFWKRIQTALKIFQYKSVTTDQLWDVLLPEENGDTLNERKRKWNTWMEQINYPLIRVTLDAKSGASVQQFHYLDPKDQIISKPSPHNYIWSVPITIITADDMSNTTVRWLVNETAHLPEVNGKEWFLLNSQQVGFYRVDYDSTLRSKISDILKSDFSQIPYENRALLLDDAFTLARNGYYTEDVAMEFSRHMSQERERTVWETFFKGSQQIERLLGSLNETSNLIRNYLVHLIDPTYQDLGFDERDEEGLSIKLLRFEIIKRACNFNIGNCRNKAEELFQRWTELGDKPKPDMVYTVACQGALTSTDNGWDAIYEKGKSEERNNRLAILRSLSCKDDKSSLGRGAKYAILSTMASFIVDQQELIELREFLENEDELNNPSATSAIDIGEINLSWLDKNKEPLKRWLEEI